MREFTLSFCRNGKNDCLFYEPSFFCGRTKNETNKHRKITSYAYTEEQMSTAIEQCILDMKNPRWVTPESWTELQKVACVVAKEDARILEYPKEIEVRCTVNSIIMRLENTLVKATYVSDETKCDSEVNQAYPAFYNLMIAQMNAEHNPELIEPFCQYFKEHEDKPNIFCVIVCKTLLHYFKLSKKLTNAAIKKIVKPKRTPDRTTFQEWINTFIQIYDVFTNEMILM